MEARLVPLSAFLSVTLACVALPAATHRTQNFVITAESEEVARKVGEAFRPSSISERNRESVVRR